MVRSLPSILQQQQTMDAMDAVPEFIHDTTAKNIIKPIKFKFPQIFINFDKNSLN
jgi:hypothetical protein